MTLYLQVGVYLASKSWETRIAAGQAVEAIASNVKPWEPPYTPRPDPAEGEEERSPPASVGDAEMLAFGTFNIKQVCMSSVTCACMYVHGVCMQVLVHGTPLLSSTGEEYQGYENDPEFQKMSTQVRGGREEWIMWTT